MAGRALHFGPDYLIPKPLDPRVLLWVAPAVAKAAMETGVARVRHRPRRTITTNWRRGWASRAR